jgi:hypothetical protein
MECESDEFEEICESFPRGKRFPASDAAAAEAGRDSDQLVTDEYCLSDDATKRTIS